MTYEELVEAIGEERALLVYDWFASYTIDDLIKLALDTFTIGQLDHLGKELSEP
jgi:hypothetical protein